MVNRKSPFHELEVLSKDWTASVVLLPSVSSAKIVLFRRHLARIGSLQGCFLQAGVLSQPFNPSYSFSGSYASLCDPELLHPI